MAISRIAVNPKKVVFAALGASDLAVQKVRKASKSLNISIPKGILSSNPKTLAGEVSKTFGSTAKDVGTRYTKLARRGEKTFEAWRQAEPTKRAAQSAKTARSQTKSAVEAARKAATSTVNGAKQAAS